MDQISWIYQNITMNVRRNYLLEKLRWYQLENFTTSTVIKDRNSEMSLLEFLTFLIGITSTSLRNIFCRLK